MTSQHEATTRGSAGGAAHAADERIDAALAGWPSTPRSAIEWDELAEGVADRVISGEAVKSEKNVSIEDLLAPPAGATTEEMQVSAPLSDGDKVNEGTAPPARVAPVAPVVNTSKSTADAAAEGRMSVQSASREHDRRSFQELARLANAAPPSGRASTPPPGPVSSRISAIPGSGAAARADRASVPPSSGPVAAPAAPAPDENDSGIVDLAALAAAEAGVAAGRAPAEAGTVGLFDDPAPASAPVSGQATAAVAKAQPAAAEKKGGAVIYVFGGLVAVAAIAAGAIFLVRGKASQQQLALAPPQPAVVQAAGAPKVAPAEKPAATAAATQAEATQLAPQATATTATTAAPSAVSKGASSGAATPAKASGSPDDKAAPANEPDKKIDPKLVVKDTPAAPAESGSLGDAMRQAAGTANPGNAQGASAPSGPQFAPGSVAQKPSQGAVTGALGAVLPGARGCLAPDDPVSRAQVVFGSDGTVKSVTVTGGAAGKAAEGCIRSALMRAKVPPFAEASYSATVTVRPN